MISTTMCTRMMMIWSVSPWRQKLNSMALARGCVHSFLSGQPATEPSGGTRVHSARSVPCVLAQNSGG